MGDQQGGVERSPTLGEVRVRVQRPQRALALPADARPVTSGVKILEITNVDFSLRHFLLPLMRALRARGHDVVGVCAEGPLLDDVRAEGFRVVAAPFARRVSPLAHWRAFRALVALLRAEQPDLVHAHMPISGFLARLAAWRAGVPRVAFTCHGFLFNNREGAWPQRAASFAMEWLGGRVTDVFLTVSTEEAADARRLGIARHAVAVGNGRDPAVFRPDPAARARLRAALGTPADRVVVVAVSRLVARKGYPRTGRRHARRAGRGAVGRRRAAGLRPRRGHGGDCCVPPAWATGCGCWAIAPTWPRCWRRPTSSCCRAISRACRCR